MATSTTEKDYATLEGKYTYVGFDIDTTGRRLIDEILQIAAYTPDEQFSQHIMPLMNLNHGAKERHQVRVINVGCFRMLKCMKNYKVIKTKTEIAALMDFLNWLEKANEGKDGIILLYHEQSKLAPYMLIESMKKFNLFERFDKIVKAFVNGYELSEDDQKGKGLKYLTLAQNYKVHADCLKLEAKDTGEFEGNATVRAKYSYEISKLMSYEGEMKDLDDKGVYEMMNKFVSSKAKPISRELDELVEMEENLSRQTDMRDIFLTYFSTSRFHRRRALEFRRALADKKHDMKSLQAIWDSEKREGIEKLVKDLESIKEEDHEEMINILEHHFDEEKKPFKPVVRRENNGPGRSGSSIRRRRSQRMSNNMNKENRGGSRTDSRRRRSRNNSKRRMSNGPNNNPKTGNVHKDQQIMNNNCDEYECNN